jgi:hypothetical protein
VVRRAPRTVVAASLLAVAALASCGGGDDEAAPEDRAELQDSLGFLVDDLGLTDEQVACTAQRIEDEIGGDALDRFAGTIRQVDAGEISVEDLPEAESDLLTGAIGTCVAGT